MIDALRGYLQIASGLTEVTSKKALEVARSLQSGGVELDPGALGGRVQGLADDLLATSRANRELLVGLVRTEVDRAVGRMGFVREEELAAVRRHVQRLESQIAALREQLEEAAPPAKATRVPAKATRAPAKATRAPAKATGARAKATKAPRTVPKEPTS